MTLTEMFSQTTTSMSDVLAAYDPNHVPLDPAQSAQLTASTVDQVRKAYRRAVWSARALSVWWAPLRTARYLKRLFTC